MYFEHGALTNRESWKYTYKGSELLSSAQRLWKKFHNEEMRDRNDLAELMKDPTVPNNDRKVEEAKNRIGFNGKQQEACSVFAHEFERNPEREYHLSLGDVVYFGLEKTGNDD